MTGIPPSGTTRLFPVVGDPIAQVLSPRALTGIFANRGENALVVPMHVSPPALSGVLRALHQVQNVGGLLVTVPHKPAALAQCTSATERAHFIGAANVVTRTADGWHGDNTDGVGYLDGIAREGFAIAGKRALLVGCGGAGAAIALEILVRNAAQLAIHDVDTVRRDMAIAKLSLRFPGKVVVGGADPSGYDLVANATPMGMKDGDPLPVDVSKLNLQQFVACVVTKPEIPPLIAEGRRRGCRTMTGAGMFEAQAEVLADLLLQEPPQLKLLA